MNTATSEDAHRGVCLCVPVSEADPGKTLLWVPAHWELESPVLSRPRLNLYCSRQCLPSRRPGPLDPEQRPFFCRMLLTVPAHVGQPETLPAQSLLPSSEQFQ